MRGEEENVFRPPGGGLGRDDVREPGHRNADPSHSEDTPLPPYLLELKAFHQQGEIDLQLSALTAHERAARYDLLRQLAVHRTFQRLITDPEIEARILAGSPCPQQVEGVGRKKQVPVLRREKKPCGTRIVVGPSDTDHHESDSCRLECTDERGERVQTQRARFAFS